MKIYGESFGDMIGEKFATRREGNWNGGQSRKVAHHLAKDKKILHQKSRSTAKNELRLELQDDIL
jgi:hypothetical protein